MPLKIAVDRSLTGRVQRFSKEPERQLSLTLAAGYGNKRGGRTIARHAAPTKVGPKRRLRMVAATATIYPTAIRSAGVGWALGIGRIGSVVGPFVGSALIAAQLPNSRLFLIGAVPVVIAGCTSLWLDAFTLRNVKRSD